MFSYGLVEEVYTHDEESSAEQSKLDQVHEIFFGDFSIGTAGYHRSATQPLEELLDCLLLFLILVPRKRERLVIWLRAMRQPVGESCNDLGSFDPWSSNDLCWIGEPTAAGEVVVKWHWHCAWVVVKGGGELKWRAM